MSETATCAKCAYTIKFPFTSGEMVKTFFDSHNCDSTKLQESIRRVRELHESTVESMQVWEKAENGIWYLGYRNFNVCRTCRITQNIQGIVYPCATIQALNGDR